MSTAATAIPSLEPLELCSGMSLGRRTTPLPESPPLGVERPREVLEALIAESLAAGPCHVSFSGGRDSSVILAVAVHVARREGLPLPVPLTGRYPDVPEAAEDEWQELVVRHLGLEDWTVFEICDEADVLGEVARELLLHHGVTGIAPAHTVVLHARQAGGGTLMTGSGGDEVFGSGGYRRRPWRTVLGTRPRRMVAWAVAHNALPLAGRRRVEARWPPAVPIPWLQPAAQAEVERIVQRASQLTTSYPDDMLALLDTRGYERVRAVLSTYASGAGVDLVEPFFDPRFIRAMSAHPPSGFHDRTATLESMFADVLPSEVLRRHTKATFTGALWGPEAQAFAAAWDGSGVDQALVDPGALKAAWATPSPDARSLPLLQHAWLATR